MKPKVLIVLVIILIIFMAVGLGIAGSGASSAWFTGAFDVENADWATTLRDWLTADLAPDAIVDVSPPTCHPSDARFVLTPGTACRAAISGSNDSTRQLKLRLLEGDAVTVVLDQENALTVETVLVGPGNGADGQAKPTALDIYKNVDLQDAELLITACEAEAKTEDAPPPTCVLALE